MRPLIWSLIATALLMPRADAATVYVTIDRDRPKALISDDLLGVNMANWFDQTQPGMAAALKTAGIKALRWPGGSASNTFHWATNADCNVGYVNSNSNFDNFMADVATPDKLDIAVARNYGSNAACDDGGDPTEAAAWVAHALAAGDKVLRFGDRQQSPIAH